LFACEKEIHGGDKRYAEKKIEKREERKENVKRSSFDCEYRGRKKKRSEGKERKGGKVEGR
jgi:hypothetical protein